MKMLYQSSRRPRSLFARTAPLLPALLGVLLIVFKVQMPGVLSDLTHSIAVPLWTTKDALEADRMRAASSEMSERALLDERAVLMEELSTLRRENYMVQALKYENQQLREVLGRGLEEDGLIPATILFSNAEAAYATVVIDVGAEQGIRESMIVTTTDGLALGSVVRALSEHSVVRLFSAHDIQFEATLVSSSTLHTVVSGKGAGTMVLRLPRGVPLADGDTVLLSTFPIYPVGYVVSIEEKPEDAFKTVYVEPPVSSYTVRHVLVDTMHNYVVPDSTLNELSNERALEYE